MNGKMMNWAYYDIFARDYRSSVVECDEIFRLLFFVVVRLKGKDYIEDGEKKIHITPLRFLKPQLAQVNVFDLLFLC